MLSTIGIIALFRRKLEFLKNCGPNSTILDFVCIKFDSPKLTIDITEVNKFLEMRIDGAQKNNVTSVCYYRNVNPVYMRTNIFISTLIYQVINDSMEK